MPYMFLFCNVIGRPGCRGQTVYMNCRDSFYLRLERCYSVSLSCHLSLALCDEETCFNWTVSTHCRIRQFKGGSYLGTSSNLTTWSAAMRRRFGQFIDYYPPTWYHCRAGRERWSEGYLCSAACLYLGVSAFQQLADEVPIFVEILLFI